MQHLGKNETNHIKVFESQALQTAGQSVFYQTLVEIIAKMSKYADC